MRFITLALTFVAAVEGHWTAKVVESGGLTRSYMTYAPAAYAGKYTGIVVFLHGLGGSSNVHKSYEVAEHSEEYGFLGLVPNGSPFGEDGDCDRYLWEGICYDCNKEEVDEEECEGLNDWGAIDDENCSYTLWEGKCYDCKKNIVKNDMCEKRRLADGKGEAPAVGGSFKWNMDDPDGINEVDFLLSMVETEMAEHSVSPDVPQIALGFSNGAGMASLLGCHDSTNLWSAHVGVFINPKADFPSTCSTGKGSKGKARTLLRRLASIDENTIKISWNAIGENDFFIASLKPTPREGILNQFSALHAASGCPQEDWAKIVEEDYTCYAYPNCVEVGELCIYDNIGHIIQPSMTRSAWRFLSSAHSRIDAPTVNEPKEESCLDDKTWAWVNKIGKARSCRFIAEKRNAGDEERAERVCGKISDSGRKGYEACPSACMMCNT